MTKTTPSAAQQQALHSKQEEGDVRDRIVQALLDAGRNRVTGSWLSTQLSLTRTAVWKHVHALNSLGFVIQASPRLGYLLERVPDVPLPPLIRPLLTTGMAFGSRVEWRAAVDSTNAYALRLARTGVAHGTVVIAGAQTGGRGRRGREWFSPVGGLWLSVILKRPLPLARAPELTLLTAVALNRAITRTAGVPTGIKWPNDLLLSGKKISGILAEIRADGEAVQHTILGIGVNTNLAASTFPAALAERATSILAETDRPLSNVALAAALLCELEPLYEDLVAGGAGFRAVAAEWRAASVTLGRAIRVNTPTGECHGEAVELDDAGVLHVRTATGEIVQVHTGDVLL